MRKRFISLLLLLQALVLSSQRLPKKKIVEVAPSITFTHFATNAKLQLSSTLVNGKRGKQAQTILLTLAGTSLKSLYPTQNSTMASSP